MTGFYIFHWKICTGTNHTAEKTIPRKSHTYICAISPTSKLTKTSGTLTVKSGQLPALSDTSGSYEGKTQALQGRDQQHKTEIKRY